MNQTASATSSLAQRFPAIDILLGRDFALVWSTEGMLWIGRAMEWTVLGLLVLKITDSPFMAEMVFISYWAPMPVLSVLSGAIADRVDRWRLLVISHAIALVVAAVLLTLILTDVVVPWHLFVAALALGLGMSLDWPARSAFMCDIAGEKNIAKAMSISSVGLAAGLLFGPLIGGLLIEAAGFEGPFIMLLIAYVITLAMVSMVRSRVKPSGASRESVAVSLKIGFVESLRNRVILGLLGCTIVMDLLAFSVVGLFPVVAQDHLHVGNILTGLLLSAQGTGMLLGTLAFIGILAVLKAIRYQGRVFAIACAGWLAGVLLFGLSPWYPLSFVVLFVSGIAMGFYTPLQRTIILVVVEPHMQGRVLGVLGAAIGTVIIGGPIVGVIAEVLDAPRAIVISASLGLVLLVPVVLLTTLVRHPIARGSGYSAAADAGGG